MGFAGSSSMEQFHDWNCSMVSTQKTRTDVLVAAMEIAATTLASKLYSKFSNTWNQYLQITSKQQQMTAFHSSFPALCGLQSKTAHHILQNNRQTTGPRQKKKNFFSFFHFSPGREYYMLHRLDFSCTFWNLFFKNQFFLLKWWLMSDCGGVEVFDLFKLTQTKIRDEWQVQNPSQKKFLLPHSFSLSQ